MGLATALAKLLLPACMVAGLLGCFKLSHDNGLLELIGEAPKQAYATLVDSETRLMTDWTGLRAVDEFASAVIVFFSPVFEPQNASLILQALHFYGTFLSIWLVMLVESYRVGNVWRPIAFAAIWGFLIENVLFAFIGPLWCLTQLLTSPTASTGPLTAERRTRLLVHPVELAIIPWAVLIGAGIPTVFSLLNVNGPTFPIVHSRQFWLLVRQFHPFITAIAHPVLSGLLGRSLAVVPKTANQRDIVVSSSLRRVYRVATYLSMLPHVVMLTLMGLAVLDPPMLSSEMADAFHPLRVYPAFPFWAKSPARVSTVAEGTAAFLVWDEAIGSAAFLLWAWALNRNELPLAASSGATSRGSGFVTNLLKTLLTLVVAGPGAAVVALVEERDELALAATGGGTRLPGIEEAGAKKEK